jgi:hypothetical protein
MRLSDQNGADAPGEHDQISGTSPQKIRVVPHWNALLALVAIGVLYALLPTKVSIGPSWLLLAPERRLLVQPIRCPCHIVRNFS